MKKSKNYLQSKMKSKGTAYLLWFFLGFHHAYLGNWGRQMLLLMMPILGVILILADKPMIIGLALIALAIIWYLFDLFFIPGYVNTVNRNLGEQIDNIERMERAELADMIKNK